MVLMIASDLHGSAYYTSKLLDAFRRENADKLLLLGDLLDDDPEGNEGCPSVSTQLNSIKDRIIAIRGNCDTEADQMLLEFPMMADHIELEVNGLRLYATHGHIWNEQFPPVMEEGAILVHGHFHISACVSHGTWLYVNPGSVSLPRAGSARSYVVLRGKTFVWKELSGTVRKEKTVVTGENGRQRDTAGTTSPESTGECLPE